MLDARQCTALFVRNVGHIKSVELITGVLVPNTFTIRHHPLNRTPVQVEKQNLNIKARKEVLVNQQRLEVSPVLALTLLQGFLRPLSSQLKGQPRSVSYSFGSSKAIKETKAEVSLIKPPLRHPPYFFSLSIPPRRGSWCSESQYLIFYSISKPTTG